MRTIFLTVSTTLALTIFIGSIFLNTILGAFGIVVTTIDTMQTLQASQQIVDHMKKRHVQKKINTKKKFTKRSAKRVTSTALAAATVGTIAVAVTMASLEVADYCEEKQELHEDENILYGKQDTFNLEQCLEEGKEDSKAMLNDLRNSSVNAISSAFESSARYSADKWAAIKLSSLEALQAIGSAGANLWESTKSLVVQ